MIFDESVWSATVTNADDFEYQLGPIVVNKPWGRPSYQNLKSILIDTYSNTEISKYDVDILGGVLFHWDKTWDIDISIRNGVIDYELIEEIINYMNGISLNKYSTLLDVKYNYRPYSEGNNFFDEGTPKLTYSYRRKQCNGLYHEYSLDSELIERVSKNLVKSTWKGPSKKLTQRIEIYGQNMINSFDAKLFLETDEEYFNSHTNRNLL